MSQVKEKKQKREFVPVEKEFEERVVAVNHITKVVKGNYRVTLYADGQEIGKTSFKLTK